jgi:hypothetical protein
MHSSLKRQKVGQLSAPAVSGAAAGLAEVDEAKAATTARAIEEETRIICELCDLGSDDFEDSRRTAGFYVLKYCYMKFVLGGCAFKQMRAWSAMPADCQPRSINNWVRNYHLLNIHVPTNRQFGIETTQYLGVVSAWQCRQTRTLYLSRHFLRQMVSKVLFFSFSL